MVLMLARVDDWFPLDIAKNYYNSQLSLVVNIGRCFVDQQDFVFADESASKTEKLPLTNTEVTAMLSQFTVQSSR